jgi:uncharacterized protein YecT (DUF1311 family)
MGRILISRRGVSTGFGTFRRRVLSVALLCAAGASFGSFSLHAFGQAKQEALPCSSETTTAGMRNCENLRYQRAEQALDWVYAKLMKRLDETGKDKLRTAQSAWLQFRQAEADFAADMARGGTLAPLIKITVMTDMTEARVVELKKSLQP